MTTPGPSAIVISDGGLPTIVAAAIEAERRTVGQSGGGGVGLMPWPGAPELAPVQATSVASLARFLRLDVIEPVLLPPVGGLDAAPGARDSLCLLAALHVAQTAGCPRIVWPVHHHHDHASIAGDLDRIAAAIDRAQLVGRLGWLDAAERAGGEPPTIETPLVDLTDAQLADLAVDLDAPVYLAWWWRSVGDPSLETRAAEERRAWLPVLGQAGWVEPGPSPRVPAPAGASIAPG